MCDDELCQCASTACHDESCDDEVCRDKDRDNKVGCDEDRDGRDRDNDCRDNEARDGEADMMMGGDEEQGDERLNQPMRLYRDLHTRMVRKHVIVLHRLAS